MGSKKEKKKKSKKDKMAKAERKLRKLLKKNKLEAKYLSKLLKEKKKKRKKSKSRESSVTEEDHLSQRAGSEPRRERIPGHKRTVESKRGNIQVNLLQQRCPTVPSQSPPLHYQHPRSRHEYHDARDDHRHQRHDDYHAPRDHPYHHHHRYHHRDAYLINEFPPQRNCWSTCSFHHRDRKPGSLQLQEEV